VFLKCLINIIRGKGLSIFNVPVVPVVTAASVIVAPLLKGVVPLRDSHHLIEGIDVYICPITGSDINERFSHPVCLVNHVLLSPVDLVLPVTDHLPGGVFDLFRSLTRFKVYTLSFVYCVSGKCSPILNIFWVNEIFSPSNRVVSCP